jgi:hypothetical protein
MIARFLGTLVGGFAAIGDVRDMAAALWNLHWKDFAISAIGLIPFSGDGVKGGATFIKFAKRSARFAEVMPLVMIGPCLAGSSNNGMSGLKLEGTLT